MFFLCSRIMVCGGVIFFSSKESVKALNACHFSKHTSGWRVDRNEIALSVTFVFHVCYVVAHEQVLVPLVSALFVFCSNFNDGRGNPRMLIFGSNEHRMPVSCKTYLLGLLRLIYNRYFMTQIINEVLSTMPNLSFSKNKKFQGKNGRHLAQENYLMTASCSRCK